MAISRIKYYNRDKNNADFEIVTMKDFFATRPQGLIEKDYRLNFWVLIYVMEGKGVHSIDFREYPYKSGDLIVIAKNHVQSFRVNHGVSGYIISINEPFFIESSEKRDMDMLAFFETPQCRPVMQVDTSESATSRQLIDLIYKEYLLIGDEGGEKLIKSLFNSFVYSIRNENRDDIRKFSTAAYKIYYEYRELVERNFTRLKSVAGYERLMGITKKTINSACRECADLSAKELIVNRIILEAKRLLAQNELKNYEISDVLGFGEPANLAGFFKRYTGMSMREFRATGNIY